MNAERLNVLVIDDEKRILSMVSRFLASNGFQVRGLSSLPSREEIMTQQPDAIVLDWQVGDACGLTWLQDLRSDPVCANLPVIMLSGRNEKEDRIFALKQGADDFLGKPASLGELTVRLHKLVRACRPRPHPYFDGELFLDPHRKQAAKHGKAIDLSAHEWSLLKCLLATDGVVTKEQAGMLVWGMDSAARGKRLEMLVLRLRRAIETEPMEPRYIITARGVGYRFAKHPSVLSRRLASSPRAG